MRNYCRLSLVIALSLPLSCVFAKTHTLKKGETLASVARKYYGEPVFGAKGSLKKLYKLNPWAEKSPNLVEPGKEIVVSEDDNNNEKPQKSAAQPTLKILPAPPPATELHAPPVPPAHAAEPNMREEKKAWDQKKIEEANAAAAAAKPEEKKEIQCPTPTTAEAPKCEECAKMSSSAKLEPSASEKISARHANEFSVLPYFAMSKISLTNSTSGATYDISSSGSYGARLGWDHRFNKSFSMVLEANTMTWNSGTANTTTAAAVADKVNLYKAELALLNNIGERSRFGIGFAYGNKIFIENFDATPANETAVTFTGIDPVVTAEFSLYDSSTFEMPLTLKWSPLAGDVDKGVAGGIKGGNEITARLMFVHKMMNSQMTYGISYITNDQAEKDRTQKRTDTNVELGMVF